jgi:membrane protein DedA with SNARE-associated domain
MDLFSFIIFHGYLFVFILLTVEGTLTNILASFASSLGYFNIGIIFLLALIGNTISDNFFYLVGRFGFKDRIAKSKNGKIKNLVKASKKHLLLSLLLIKISPFSPIGLTLIGATKLRFKTYFLWSLITTIPLVLLISLVGYLYGSSTKSIIRYVGIWQYIIFSIIIFITVLYLLNKKQKKRFK